MSTFLAYAVFTPLGIIALALVALVVVTIIGGHTYRVVRNRRFEVEARQFFLETLPDRGTDT